MHMDLDRNTHSVFMLNYHLVLAVKYRRQAIDDKVSQRAKEIFEYIAPKYKITLLEWEHGKGHINAMYKANPRSEISKFINAYKSASSRLVKKEYPEILTKLWNEAFWSKVFA